MIRVAVLAFLALSVTACSVAEPPGKPTFLASYVTVEGVARMLAAEGVAEKWKTAQHLCNEAGYQTGSNAFLECFKAYQAHDLRATRARAKALTEAVARQHGLCIDRTRFEISRCLEI